MDCSLTRPVAQRRRMKAHCYPIVAFLLFCSFGGWPIPLTWDSLLSGFTLSRPMDRLAVSARDFVWVELTWY